MNKFIIALVFVLSLFCLFGNETGKSDKSELLKRNVLILPFINQNKNEKYDYLSNTLMDALKADIMNTNQFNLSNPVQFDNKMEEFNLTEENILTPSKAVEIALKLESDVVVTGKYIVIEDKIMIQIQAVDVFTGEIVIALDARGVTGISLLNLIDKVAADLTAKMVEKLPKVNRTYFTEMIKLLEKKERENRIKHFKNSLTSLNKTGMGLCISGSVFLITGLPLLIYDLAGYSQIYRINKNAYYDNKIDINTANSSREIFIGLFLSGLIISSIGLVAVVASIPLIIYKKKKTSFNFNLEMNKDIRLCFSIKK